MSKQRASARRESSLLFPAQSQQRSRLPTACQRVVYAMRKQRWWRG